MTAIDEQAAVLALTKATHDKPWFYTTRVIAAAGSALGVLDGMFTARDEDDQAHATAIAARVQPEDLDWARDLIAAMRAEGVHLVTVLDKSYPGNLYSAYDRQPFLWVRGGIEPGDYRAVAVIGENDVAQAAAAARALAGAGLTVVSPLCSDLDAAVHEAAFAAGGRTLGVIAGGLAAPSTPGVHASVAKQIAERGAVVSPFWPHIDPTETTIELARIVTCGLADCVYVVDGHPGGLSDGHAARALATGKSVLVPQRFQQAQPWVASADRRAGMTVVQDIDDLIRQAVNLVDMTPRLHVS
ncbi:DNA-processing protein DprA [Nonomuraea wenchangensis]|uniref:DNA-processing protein DprA n=1 Tax=Nonomuraea wenchangensis TaxID=568860 RepID=UPI0033274062